MSNQENVTEVGTGAEEVKGSSRMSTKYLVRVALFAALSFIVMFFEFPIWTIFPAYLKVDFSEVVVFIGGMVLGPVAVIFMEIVKNLINLMLKSSTGGIGELANFTVGVALILPAVMILRKKEGFVNGIIAFAVGIVVMIIVASVGNYFIFLPVYGVTDPAARLGMIVPTLIPFNAIKGVIVAVFSLSLHQTIKGLYKHLK